MTTQQILLGGAPSGAYNLTRSLRFRASASAYLSRTPSVGGNLRTCTWSGWVKRGKLGATQGIFEADQPSGTNSFYVTSGDQLNFQLYYNPGGYNTIWATAAVFRDPSAWYHIILVMDTTQALVANMVKMYVNGVQQSVTATNYGTNAIPQNSTWAINAAGIVHRFGTYTGTNYLDGYLAEINFIDGQALTPSSFGSTNSFGVWQPAPYTGTYGTNGFYLPFTDNSALTTSSNVGLGKDFSGNGNYWVTNNISITAGVTYDSMTDVPTLTSATAANFCTLNYLKSNSTLSQGNLYSVEAGAGSRVATGTIGMSSGKWYWETTIGASGNLIGICNSAISATDGSLTATSNGWGYASDGNLYPGGVSGNSTYTTNDVIGFAFNADSGVLSFYKNNVLQPKTFTGLTSGPYFAGSGNTNGAAQYYNFGQRPFTYTPPTGFVALNAYNLPDSTIKQGNKYMDATLWSGNDVSPRAITNNASFQPDFVWVKNRTTSGWWNVLFDSVRGAGNQLSSNQTDAELASASNVAGKVSAFNSNGFSLSAGSSNSASVNGTGGNYVGWQWQAGQGTTSTNTAGSITSTVSVNSTAGFSMATYSGSSANATVGHGLGVAPSFVIVKRRNGNSSWCVWHNKLTSGAYSLFLETVDAQASYPTVWNSITPTSSVISVGTDSAVNATGSNYVAYSWAQIAGFSKFDSFVGNGSTDGPFVYLGFRPKFVMFKRINTTGDWFIEDGTRNPYNVVDNYLFANSSAAEGSSYPIADFTSNGFKLRTTDAGVNGSGSTIIYAAFAENPFKLALAR